MPTKPKVSICLPNLNTLPFLPDRTASILSQTFQDWELYAFDSHSDDGAWDYLRSVAAKEPRMRLSQGPREGPYPAWNQCVGDTSGEYVYIATSDDTMAPDCLERLVNALDQHPDCDLAHCPLRVIDSSSSLMTWPAWPGPTVFAEGSPEDIINIRHLRRAPFNGLLYLTGKPVIMSITQVLIRRSLFFKIGVFPVKWGSLGDINWGMRAGLVSNMVHVPETWASWRIHPKQLTPTGTFRSLKMDLIFEDMIQDAMRFGRIHLPPCVNNNSWFEETKSLREYYSYLGHERPVKDRRLHQVRRAITGPNIVRVELLRQVTGRSKWPDYAPSRIRRWLESEGLSPIEFF